jgi:arylsulfatase
VLNKSFAITAEVTPNSKGTQGAILSLGGADGGYGLYVRDNRPVFAGNFLGRTVTRATSRAPLPAGPVTLRGEFRYDGGGLGKGGVLTLFVNGKKVGEGRLEQTQGITLGLGGTLDIGADTGSAVDEAYTPPFAFNGQIKRVTVELKPNQ